MNVVNKRRFSSFNEYFSIFKILHALKYEYFLQLLRKMNNSIQSIMLFTRVNKKTTVYKKF